MQNDEYLASLQADREKELMAMAEENAAREAALEEQKRKDEEAQRKLQEEQVSFQPFVGVEMLGWLTSYYNFCVC